MAMAHAKHVRGAVGSACLCKCLYASLHTCLHTHACTLPRTATHTVAIIHSQVCTCLHTCIYTFLQTGLHKYLAEQRRGAVGSRIVSHRDSCPCPCTRPRTCPCACPCTCPYMHTVWDMSIGMTIDVCMTHADMCIYMYIYMCTELYIGRVVVKFRSWIQQQAPKFECMCASKTSINTNAKACA